MLSRGTRELQSTMYEKVGKIPDTASMILYDITRVEKCEWKKKIVG